MLFNKETIIEILTQVSIHAPRKLIADKKWVKDMKLPSHLKSGLRIEPSDTGLDVTFDKQSIGYIKYELGTFVGVYRNIEQ